MSALYSLRNFFQPLARWLLVAAGGMVSLPSPGALGADSPTSAAPPFLNAPRIVTTQPGENHRAATRHFQGIPSIACSPRGRLWVAWYGGPGKGEDRTNYVSVATSENEGRTWSEERLVIDPDENGPVRAFDPQAWVDPRGHLWVFWAQTVDHDGSIAGTWAVTTETPDSPNPRWSTPRRLGDGIMMGKPLVLSTGEWCLPISTWKKTDSSAKFVVSTDRGQNWSVRGAAHVPVDLRDFDEHSVVERRDGSLWMLVRLAADAEKAKSGATQYCIGESVSTDRGKTWTTVARGPIPHVRSRFFIRRLASGNLLLIKHADKATNRKDLTAYLSRDEGKNWLGGLTIEAETCSYPDAVQSRDGRIFVTYDRERRKEGFIQVAVITEDDVATGRAAQAKVPVKSVVSRLSEPRTSEVKAPDSRSLSPAVSSPQRRRDSL